MSAGSTRTLVSVLVLLALAGAIGWYFTRPQVPTAPPIASRSIDPAVAPGAPPAVTQLPVGVAPTQPGPSAALPGAGGSTGVPDPRAPAPAASPSSEPARAAASTAAGPVGPSFDVVRVEPTGESVIAGRATPGATVELLRNGQPFSRTVADGSGLFAIVPPELPAGSHEIALQATSPEGGSRTRSAQSVTVVVAADRKQKPLVTVTAPDQPTIVLSRPDEPAPPPSTSTTVAAKSAGQVAAGTPAAQSPARRPEIRIGAVEAEGTGRLFVSGQAAPGATIRLYLNDAYVAPSGTGPDGRLSFSIERGIQPGDYRVRLDDVDPVTGAVRSRAEVPFTVPPAPPPATVAEAAPNGPGRAVASASRASDVPTSREQIAPQGTSPAIGGQPGPSGRTASAERPGQVPSVTAVPREVAMAEPGQVVVPEISTAIVARGDNLWRISKRVYGQGLRYTVIFGANTPQIRNPDLIYPGQIFVLPSDGTRTP